MTHSPEYLADIIAQTQQGFYRSTPQQRFAEQPLLAIELILRSILIHEGSRRRPDINTALNAIAAIGRMPDVVADINAGYAQLDRVEPEPPAADTY